MTNILTLLEEPMDPTRLVKASKYLSKHLRHAPERLGLALAPGGWVAVEELLAACERHRFPLTRAELDEVVAKSDKKRFAFDESGALIRANQGHTVGVDLELAPAEPPALLYHGTPERNVDAILTMGILKMARHHVHLSADTATATKVGARRGRPIVLVVDAAQMHRDGLTFLCSANGVWLVDHVPPAYVRR